MKQEDNMIKSNVYVSGIQTKDKTILPLSYLKKLKNTENISYFDLIISAKEAYFITIEKRDYLIGLISLVKVDEKEWLIQSVDIAENERRKGNSKILIEEFFKFASSNIKDEIIQSSYSEMGFVCIFNTFKKIKENYQTVKFIDHIKKGFYTIS